jgi:hypothetical protein
MKSSCHSLIPFLPLFCNCQFRRLDSIQFLCSQAHILAGWSLETPLFTLDYFILLNTSLQPLCTDHEENTASFVKEVYCSLPNNERPFVARVCFAGMYLISQSSNGYTCHNIIPAIGLIRQHCSSCV